MGGVIGIPEYSELHIDILLHILHITYLCYVVCMEDMRNVGFSCRAQV